MLPIPHEPSLIAVSSATSDTELRELLAGEPLAFLALAAEAISHPHQQPIPDLLADLTALASFEALAIASAIAWLSDTAQPPPCATSQGGPVWLTRLDQARFVNARQRKERPDKRSYLLEVEFVGGGTGTVHGRIDGRQGGALTNAWVTDEPLSTIEGLICSVTRQPDRYSILRPKLAADALAIGVEQSVGAEIPSPLVNRWPALRPLIEFALTTWRTA